MTSIEVVLSSGHYNADEEYSTLIELVREYGGDCPLGIAWGECDLLDSAGMTAEIIAASDVDGNLCQDLVDLINNLQTEQVFYYEDGDLLAEDDKQYFRR